jgi:beta-lactamase superfamily II metal-dependent hydrolase
MPPPSIAADARVPRVHLLDVGPEEYADAVLCQFGDRVILIDGAHPGDHTGREGHPSIPDQLRDLLHGSPPYHLDLLIVSHAHQDHIGCLPRLVRERVIEADWALVADPDLGWGRAVDEDRDARIQDERVRALVATLRDECAPLRRRLADGTLDQFMQDAANLEDTYRGMLRTLTERHTRVVRSGRDDIQPLQAALADVGLRVIGPSQAQALACADLINGLTHDAIDWATDRFARDATATAADVYRRIAVGEADAVDVSRPGPAVNLQSLTTVFEVAGHRFLFAGDMQLAKPQVSSPIVTREVKALRRAIRQRAPYSLVKLSHHGSDNAFSEELLIELGGTVLFGICAGEHSEVHPNPATLRLLHAHRDEIRWARTDRNGRVTMSFGAGTPRVRLSQGRINDERPNTSDVPVGTGAGEGEGTARLAVTPAAGPPARGRADDGLVEVEARIPHVETRVTITVDVTPGGASAAASPGSATARAVSGGDSLRLGGGRALPRLLFVTGSDALSRNIGEAEAALIRDAIRRAGMPLCDDLPDGLPDSVAAAERVRRRLRDTPDLAGVVLVGAHDVVPHQRLDCLPAALRTALPDTDDPDQFIVWSDEIYGDRDGDGLPELPVSRIPDGRSAALVMGALQAGPPTRQERAGVRNVARPFADGVFAGIAGRRALFVSEPTVFDQVPALDLDGDQLYFMLHGDYVDGGRFWGEGTANQREAVNLSNLPRRVRGVVFTGCCWGALTTETPAGLVVAGRPFGSKTPESSIALACLHRGATAFVGCTGAHYSPIQAPYRYFGGPMHHAFWRGVGAGISPARALFDAKIEYLRGMPHGRDSDEQQAIEFKILRQYTCLGLGW